jgi:hypothetical protein
MSWLSQLQWKKNIRNDIQHNSARFLSIGGLRLNVFTCRFRSVRSAYMQKKLVKKSYSNIPILAICCGSIDRALPFGKQARRGINNDGIDTGIDH